MLLVVKTKWNPKITDSICEAAIKRLSENGFETLTIQVPGALEIPLAIQWALEEAVPVIEGVVACGSVLKGDTYHFEIVANESARALTDLSLKFRIPIGNAIICAYSLEQAQERASNSYNKGIEAADAVIDMLNLKKERGYR